MNTIRFFGPRVWNALDERIESQRSVGLFKSKFSQTCPYLPICISAFFPRSLSSRGFIYPYYFILFIYRCFCLNRFLPLFSFLYFYFHCICIIILCSLFCVSVSIVMSLVCLSFVCVCLTGCFLQASVYLNSLMLYFIIFISLFTRGLFTLCLLFIYT